MVVLPSAQLRSPLSFPDPAANGAASSADSGALTGVPVSPPFRMYAVQSCGFGPNGGPAAVHEFDISCQEYAPA